MLVSAGEQEFHIIVELDIIVFFLNFLIFHFAGLKSPQKPIKIFRLPDFPPPLAYHYVQNYYSDMVASLGKAINMTPSEESALLARYCKEKKLLGGEVIF